MLRAENKHAARITSIMDNAAAEIDLTDPHNIDISSELRRRAVYREIRKRNEEIYHLGAKHALCTIQSKVIPRTRSA